MNELAGRMWWQLGDGRVRHLIWASDGTGSNAAAVCGAKGQGHADDDLPCCKRCWAKATATARASA